MVDKKSINLVVSDSIIHNLSDSLIDITAAVIQDKDIEITLNTEGPCLESLTYRSQSNLLQLLEKICMEHHYDKNRIQIITGNFIQPRVWPNIKIVNSVDGWFYGKHIQKIQQQKTFQFHFGSFVSNCTWPRLLIGSHLLCKHPSKTFQTFRRNPKDPAQAVDLSLDQLMFNCMDPKVLGPVTDFIHQLPIEKEEGLAEHPMTNIDAGEDGDAINPTITGWYEKFFCDVVTETFFTGKTFFPTEKTTRPLMCGNPFLIHGPVNYLANLRKLGFKTFNGFWDESYDNWHGYERYKMIAKIIDDLSSMTSDDLDVLYKKMLPVLEHNQNQIENLSAGDFKVFM